MIMEIDRIYMIDDNNNSILVDVIVSNCRIRALRPVFDSKNAMPNSDVEKLVWWQNTTDSDRLNRRVLGSLCGKALKKAQKLVSENGRINISGEYGSLLVSQEDFIRII
jgi:hypothetical protein